MSFVSRQTCCGPASCSRAPAAHVAAVGRGLVGCGRRISVFGWQAQKHCAGRSASACTLGAYAPHIDLTPQRSSDPMAALMDNGVYTPGQVMTVHSKEELELLLNQHPDQLAVLMCKVRMAALVLC